MAAEGTPAHKLGLLVAICFLLLMVRPGPFSPAYRTAFLCCFVSFQVWRGLHVAIPRQGEWTAATNPTSQDPTAGRLLTRNLIGSEAKHRDDEYRLRMRVRALPSPDKH